MPFSSEDAARLIGRAQDYILDHDFVQNASTFIQEASETLSELPFVGDGSLQMVLQAALLMQRFIDRYKS